MRPQASPLEDVRGAVRRETWQLPRRPGVYTQQATLAYLHSPKNGSAELWVQIEFSPSAKLFADMPDVDGDGFYEIYARVAIKALPSELVQRIQQDYAGRKLDAAEVHRWANELASYWYPSYNTDVVDIGSHRMWPVADTEESIVAAL